MIYIIHGDDTLNSLQKYKDLTRLVDGFQEMDGKSILPSEIEMMYESNLLFETNEARSIVIKDFLKLSKESLAKLIEIANDTNHNTYIWEGKKIDLRLIKKFKTPQIFEFSLPKFYFQFLDSIKPGNVNGSIGYLNSLSNQISDEQIFYSLIKRVRQLLMVKVGSQKFEEMAKMSSWQLSKLDAQARAWDAQKLKNVYKKLFDLEIGLKTSMLPTDLIRHIDILLLNELQ